ncbi:hypothetical protein GDN83_15660 [Gordonia jinghuaiqii]|nr:hypothetical protein [Gordonia jinghuaiqii]
MWRNAWPFFVAVGVVGIAVLSIVVSNITRPPEERVGDSAQVQYAINDHYTARNGPNYAEYRANTCAADLAAADFVTEEQFVSDNKQSLAENGHIEIPEITDLVVDGDRATATVHWHYDNTPDTENVVETTVVRENGEWKVCSS